MSELTDQQCADIVKRGNRYMQDTDPWAGRRIPSSITNPHDLDPAGYAKAASALGAKSVQVNLPSGDDAAVEALSDLINPLYAPRDNARNQLAAIRAGKVPTVKAEPYPGLVGIALYDEQVGMRDAIIARLAAQVAERTRERDEWKANHDNAVAIKRAVLDRPDLGTQSRRVLELVAERDKALADLAAERERAEMAEDELREHNPAHWHALAATLRREAGEARAEAADAIAQLAAQREETSTAQRAARDALAEAEAAKAELEKVRDGLRELWYTRVPTGMKLEEFLCEIGQQALWHKLFLLVEPKNAIRAAGVEVAP